MPQWVRRRHLLGIVIVVLICVTMEFMHGYGWLQTAENAYYDLWHLLSGKRSEAKHSIIVAVDDSTLLQHRDEPMAFWGPHFAEVIRRLRSAGAAAIGIDFLFSVSAESWLNRIEGAQSDLSRTYDIPMRMELNKGGVVLIAMIAGASSGKNEILMPVPDYLFSLPAAVQDVALANLYLDDDEVVRRFVPALFGENVQPRYSLAVLLAMRAAAGRKLHLTATPQNPQRIGYIGPPRTVPRISFGSLLQGSPESDLDLKEKVSGKVVIVSAEHSGNYDTHLTPYAQRLLHKGGAMMSGAEIHANIVETLFSGSFPVPVRPWQRTGGLILIVATGTFLALRFRPLIGFFCIALLIFLCIGIGYALFLNYLYLPIFYVQLALGYVYIASIATRLTGEEKTRLHLQRVISPYVSDEVVEEILKSGQIPDLGGKSFSVTVLFSDIRNFTFISSKLDSHEVVEMLNRYFSEVCEPIMSRGGMVDKFIGDAVMAIFGAPVGYEDHAKRCMKAALDMIRIAASFEAWMRKRFGHYNLPPFRIGVGIHTGTAVVGNIGSRRRMGYTAIGDCVNVASRLESESKRLKWDIVVSRAAIDAAGPGIVTRGHARVVVKGKETEEIEVFEIVDTPNGKEEIDEAKS